MTEEIKEILNRFNFVKNETNKLSYYPEDLLSRSDMWLLYDYITNLQQELEKANDTLDTHNELIEYLQQDLDRANDIIEKDRQFYKCRMDEYVDLKKENERLKEDNFLIKSANKLVSDNLHNYKSRCDKAIEYINNNKLYNFEYDDEEIFEMVSDNDARYYLVNILNGVDENENVHK